MVVNGTVDQERIRGIRNAALASFFLGWAPVLGKLAYGQGVGVFTLPAIRTLVAVVLLWIVYLLFLRSSLFAGWRELLGCLAVGTINGIGSLLYYSGLQRLDASRASLLNNLYPLWVMVFLTASGEPLKPLKLLRVGLAMAGVYLLTIGGVGEPDWLGVALMVASAATYGFHLVMAQWVLVDVDSQTATLYILTAMGGVVGLARIFQGAPVEHINAMGWGAILALGITTALSRLLMFAGLERLGGIETALVGLLEILVSLGLAFLLLDDRLALVQWIGGVILISGVLLGGREVTPPDDSSWWEERELV